MKFLYNILIIVSEKLLMLFGNFFGQKVKLFRSGQKHIFPYLKDCLHSENNKIWFHVSSLGEYEQALPVIEKIKAKYPEYQIILSFFSPSGYEIKKDKTPADCVTYLPVDSLGNVRKFLNLVQPAAVFFVKYDFWPNYLFELKNRKIPTYLISGLFTANHSFFKPYNVWLKKSLFAFTHFFVQDENSKRVLLRQGFQNVTVTGDTRFDRVFQIASQAVELDFVKQFKQNKTLLVAGSTWEQDETLLIPYINQSNNNLKTIIAPHQVDAKHIEKITGLLQKKFIRYSEIGAETNLTEFEILIIDTIGLLNKIYRYADIVYIGNGFGKSIHNIQEPAVYGVPVITGPHIHKFKEAVDLHRLGGLVVIHNQNELHDVLDSLTAQPALRKEKAKITRNYALQNAGATEKILKYLQNKL
jgi:3-deoxy-D-manno-octulosonic-acid transferase